VIVLHSNVSPEREASLATLCAEILRTQGSYDEAVREAARLAAANGWQVVSDTSYEGYEEVPRDVMQGYAVMADELPAGHGVERHCPFTHVILQGGVGGLAAGIVSYLCESYGDRRPVFVIVEPEQAACLLESARLGHAASATGSVDSVMAGLACGQASPLAWRFLEPAVDFFITVSDAQAVEAMRELAAGEGGDAPLLSGESGAAGLAALKALAQSPAFRDQAGLGPESRVLIINTEGATAPAIYEHLSGHPPQAVLAAQRKWLAGRPK
jgi:diaminopropionate ammonia-lyase family